MRRTYAEHALREVASLDGLWTMRPLDGTDRSFAAMVPGVWARIPALANYRGEADYARDVRIERAGHYLLRMGAVSHTGRVHWDGAPVGEHYNAYTGFDVLLRDVQPGVHALRVRVDNRFTEDSALHIPNDYTTYGGITRGVELHRVGAAYLSRMAFHAEQTGEGAYRAHVRVFVRAVEDAQDVRLALTLAGACAQLTAGNLRAGEERALDAALEVSGVTPWGVLDAHLYELRAALSIAGEAADDLIDRVGFRTVACAGERILLNGQPVRIRGFNRHEDHGLFGCALPVEAMMDDLQLILDSGANAVRTCHYPNDPRLLDLCDELGILVWEEHHARALPIEILRTERFARQEAACNEEMVAQHVNHPCIVIWGVLNECESETQEGRAIYAAQLAHMRRLDPTRPVSFASCRFFTDICMDLVDICSFNIYPKWYHEEGAAPYLHRLTAWMDEVGAAGKPILITEVGAGGIAGYHDPFGRAKWSEERQCDILREQLGAILAHERVCGVFIWQFADVPVAEEWAMHRPKAQNNKGVVDLYRRPKLSYFAVKEIFGKA